MKKRCMLFVVWLLLLTGCGKLQETEQEEEEDAEGQTAENPEPYIIKGSVLHAGSLEDADEQ